MSVGNSGSRLVGNTEFYGGLSTDRKIGIENSYYDGMCLDVRKSPSQMTVLPQSREIDDNNVITGLITAMTQTKDGTIWALDENGKLYSINDQNQITAIGSQSTTSGHGLQYVQNQDALWFTDGGHSLISYSKIINPRNAARSFHKFEAINDYSKFVVNSITKNFAGNYFANPDVPRNDEGTHGNGNPTPTYYDYTCPQTISENEADKILFLPGVTPVLRVGIFVKTKGSGTLKVVIHDENNNVVGESNTIAAANITANGYTMFNVLPNPAQPMSVRNQTNVIAWAGDISEAGGEYHIHVVASSTGYVLQTVTNGSLYFGGRFIADGSFLSETFNGKHPMANHKSLYIGNGQYVAELQAQGLADDLDDTMFLPQRLRLDDGFEVCSIATSDEYIVIGAEKYSTDSKRGFQAGRIYFWDESSDGPNFFIDCNIGSPRCIYNFANITYIVVNGALYAYTGGKELIKVRTMKGTDNEFTGENTTTDVYPNMITTRREIMLVGFPSTTTSHKTRFGIYGWGSIDKNYPNSFTHNYTIPGAEKQYNTDNQTLRLGCVYNFGDSLFYGYEINGNPALAVVDNESGSAQSFHWVSLCYDAGSPILEKSGLRIGIYFDKLPEGVTITPIFRIDEGDVFPVSSGEYETVEINGELYCKGKHTAVAGDRSVRCEVNQRIHEFQYGFIGTTENHMTTPVIKQVTAEVRINNEERKI